MNRIVTGGPGGGALWNRGVNPDRGTDRVPVKFWDSSLLLGGCGAASGLSAGGLSRIEQVLPALNLAFRSAK